MSIGIVILLSLIASAFFSGMEIAFVSANRLKIELEKSKNKFRAKILSNFVRKPSRFIAALLLGNNVALVIYGIAMAKLLKPGIVSCLPDAINSDFLVLFAQTIISTILILILAEFIPKALFRINPNAIISFFAPLLIVFYWMFYPIIYIFIILSEILLRLIFRVRITEQDIAFSPIDLDNYVREFSPNDEEENEISQEIQMFKNAIDFSNVKMRECMIPRNEIMAFNIEAPLSEIKKKFIETGFSRIPVFKESIDNIVGYLHSFDLFKKPKKTTSIIRSINYIPETMTANDALQNLLKKKQNISVVVDEFGGTSGIVTIEDIIEEIFGEIIDEHDTEELTEHKNNDFEYIFSARLEIDYLNDKYKLNIPDSDDYETLAGYIISKHEAIPKNKDIIKVDNFLFEILEVSQTKIEKVMLTVIEE